MGWRSQVQYDPDLTGPRALIAAVDDAGFEASLDATRRATDLQANSKVLTDVEGDISARSIERTHHDVACQHRCKHKTHALHISTILVCAVSQHNIRPEPARAWL